MRSNLKAPGLTSRKNADGTRRWYWAASTAARAQGYRPTAVRITMPTGGPIDFNDPLHQAFVEGRCQRLQAEMLEIIGGQKHTTFDGSLSALLDKYEGDSDSPFQDLKHKTRRDYQKDLKRLRVACGARQLSELHRADFKRWYDAARKPKQEGGPERLRSARGLMVMLRIVMGYGAAEELPHCARLRAILAEMRFKSPKPRGVCPTFAQTKAVYEAAKAAGCASIALGTALQFEGMLRQYDVSGSWEPLREGEEAAITLNGRRWSGITWGDIGSDGVLRWETPKRDRYIEIDLSLYPLVSEAAALVPKERRVGPLIIDERTGRPYAEGHYGKRWREFADKAGLPKDIWNRDYRAGGVTEGRASGADIADVSKHAAHSDPGFTARVYDRGTLEASRRVANARIKHRSGK